MGVVPPICWGRYDLEKCLSAPELIAAIAAMQKPDVPGDDAAYPDRFYFTFGLAGLGAAHLVRSVFGPDDLWLAVSVWLGAGAFR